MVPPDHASILEESPITVATALRLPAVQRGLPEVLAGADELDRPVRWAHAGEAPNIASLLRGGELLLLIGAGIGKRAPEQRRFVRDLVTRGIAALAIELGHIFPRMPPALIEEARRLDLPLIALNREVAFIEITEAIHRSIVNRQFAVMQRGEEMHRRFSELMIHGAGIPEALLTLSQTISNPVVLEKSGHGVLFHASHRGSDDEALTAWESLHRGIDEVSEHFVAPVRMRDDETWGQLVALALDSPIDDFDRVAIERAVGVIALALLRSRQEEILSVRERGNFLVELMDERVDEHAAGTRARALGLEPPTPWLLPAAAMIAATGAALTVTGDEATWALTWRDVGRDMASEGTRMITGTCRTGTEALIVLALSDPEQREAIADRLAAALHEASARHLGRADACLLGVGAPKPTWPRVGAELRRTTTATVDAPHVTGGPWYDTTTPDLRRLLWTLREQPELRTFVEQRLRPLLEYDRRHRVKLLPTLAVYCAHNGRVAEAARELVLERQSMYGRLRRIEAVVEVDLRDEEARLGLHLAVRALQVVDPELARDALGDGRT